MNTTSIKILLATTHESFTQQLQSAQNTGWADWANQAVELHTYRADQENRLKDGKGFYKLNEESIAIVREDLTQDYQALATLNEQRKAEEGKRCLPSYSPDNDSREHTIEGP